jgi:molybdopterin-guanine dinucleotide biosynthesis protein A
MRTLGVLLAGGRGERLGAGVPKALVMCAGRTLLERSRALLATLCDEFIVMAPADMLLPLSAGERMDDAPGNAGPLPAMIAGLRSRDHDEALVLAVDLPLLDVDALTRLRARRGESLAAVARPGGVAQPLAAWYSDRAHERLGAELAAGERAVTVAVERLSPVHVDDAALSQWPGGREAWLNVNTSEELAFAEAKLLAARR